MIDNNETNIEEITKDTTIKKRNRAGKAGFIIFWLIFFLLIVLIAIKGAIDLSEVMTLNAQFTGATYTKADIDNLTIALNKKLVTENESLHPGYRMDMTVNNSYHVYSSEDGSTASVFYTVKFRNNTYTIVGYTGSNYFNGLNTLFNYRDTLIKNGDYTWDNSYIPEAGEELPEVTPTTSPTHTLDGTPITNETDNTDEVIERGGEEEEEYDGTEEQ